MSERDLLVELQRALAIARDAIATRLDTWTPGLESGGAGPSGGRGADVSKWEYTTWRVRSIWGQRAEVLVVDGAEFAAEERPPLYETLARAGEDGWELVAYDSNDGAMIFKRPKAEG